METNTDFKIRSSAQGLFMMMTNGFGAMGGSLLSGWVIQNYFTLSNGDKMWHEIWLYFAGYALIITILFGIFFKHKHDPNELKEIHH